MTRKNCCQCATDAQITVHISEEINVPHVAKNIFIRLFPSVSDLSLVLLSKQGNILTISPTEILPLVEFYPDTDIPEQEAERLLLAPPKQDVLSNDPFVDSMVHEDISNSMPLTLNRDALRGIDPTTVLIARWAPPLKTKYYRNLLPELQISVCPECLQVTFPHIFQ